MRVSVAVPDDALGLHPGSLEVRAGESKASLEQESISSGMARWVEIEGVQTDPAGSLRIEFSAE